MMIFGKFFPVTVQKCYVKNAKQFLYTFLPSRKIEMSKLNVFALFGIVFLSSILLGSGMYSNNVSVLAQQENKAEVEADIEQENKCKKDTECENENELNNQLDITTTTGQQQEEPGTLIVNKEIFGCTTSPSSFTMDCVELQDGSASWLPCIGSTISGTTFCQNLPPNLFDIEVLNDQNTQIQQFEGSTAGTTIQNLQPGTYTVNEIKSTPGSQNQLVQYDEVQQTCTTLNGFDDGGVLFNTNILPNFGYSICFEYEDEQGNDCSTVTLAAGEEKTCTVKNYILIGNILPI